jgi:hypothetical protein
MSAGPITFSATLDTAAAAAEVLPQLRQLSWGPAARLQQPDSLTLHVRSGSKLRYRLLGAWSGSEHLPLQAAFHLEPHEEGTTVHFTVTSDGGWYLRQTSLARDAYRDRFEELLGALSANGAVERS